MFSLPAAVIIHKGFEPGSCRGSNFFKEVVQVLISIETHITCDFPGEGSGTQIPPLDWHMITCKCKLLCNKFNTESEPHMGRCINYIIRKI